MNLLCNATAHLRAPGILLLAVGDSSEYQRDGEAFAQQKKKKGGAGQILCPEWARLQVFSLGSH